MSKFERERPARVSLLCRNLPLDASSDDVRKKFEQFGEVRDVYLPRDFYTQRSRGFGFVEFREARDAEDAMDRLDKSMYDGREITVVMSKEARKTPREMTKIDPRARYDAERSDRRRSRSPRRRRSYSRSPRRHRRRSPSRSRSPPRRERRRSPTPPRRDRRSPVRRSGDRSPVRRSGDRSPVRRGDRSRSPARRSSRSPVRRSSRSRSRSPVPAARRERSLSPAQNGHSAGEIPPEDDILAEERAQRSPTPEPATKANGVEAKDDLEPGEAPEAEEGKPEED